MIEDGKLDKDNNPLKVIISVFFAIFILFILLLFFLSLKL